MTDGARLPPVARLAQPRRGHFDLGTGFHGDLWLDLDALFLHPARLRPYVQWLSARLDAHQIDAVCGPLEGGAFLALAVADVLDTAFLPAARAPGPGRTGYRLPPGPGRRVAGQRVAIVDDAINAGTAVTACFRLLRERGAVPVGGRRPAGPRPGRRDHRGHHVGPVLRSRHGPQPGVARHRLPPVRDRHPP